MQNEIYLYGMILATSSFLLKDGFIKPDEYSEMSEKFCLPGGETGTCATVLASLGANVRMDGNHIGVNVEPVIKNFYKNKSVNLDSLFFDPNYDGLEDYVIIADGVRSPMGMFHQYYASGENRWNMPKEEDIAKCLVAGIDPYFGEATQRAAEYCVKHGKPYVTVDCEYDSYLHKHAAVSVISGECISDHYAGMTREELFPLFQENGDGLTIITHGGNKFTYGRRGGEIKYFEPYKVNIVSTLGAGDTFKAGCVYAISQNMSDDDIVKFASACSAVAISRFPIPLNPPTLPEIYEVMGQK